MKIRTRLARWMLRGVHPSDPALADWLSNNVSTAGVFVTPETAMRVAAVYSCVRVLSETLASLPLVVYRRKPDGGKEVAKNHWLSPMLGRSPNGWMTSFEWREMAMAHMCLRGVTYTRVIADRSGKRQFIPLHPDRVRCFMLDNGQLAYKVQQQNGSEITLLQDEVLRIPFMTFDGITPITPVQAQRETIGAAIATQEHSNRFWANDARPTGGWIEMEGDFKDESARKSFRDQWHENSSGANRHKVQFLKKGMTYHPFSMSMVDAQYIESQKMQRSQIAGIYRVPPHFIGDMEKTSFASVEQQSLDFVVHTMNPWITRWEQALEAGLLTEAEQNEYAIRFSVDSLLRGDATARANYFRTAILTGWLNRNEVREIENRNKADGLDEFLAPLNMAPAPLLTDVIGGNTP